MKTTWKPHKQRGQLDSAERNDLPDSAYAFPDKRKEPLTDAKHVRNAVARFDQVTGVSDTERALAFRNIEKAAQHYDVDLSETDWHDLGAHPQRHRKEAAAKGVETRRKRGELKSAAEKAVATKRKSGVLKSAAKKAAATRKRKSD
jgi:hypothetical protein